MADANARINDILIRGFNFADELEVLLEDLKADEYSVDKAVAIYNALLFIKNRYEKPAYRERIPFKANGFRR